MPKPNPEELERAANLLTHASRNPTVCNRVGRDRVIWAAGAADALMWAMGISPDFQDVLEELVNVMLDCVEIDATTPPREPQ